MFVGDSLRNVRIMYGYSRKHLSEKIGVSEQAVWQFENGFSSPKLETLNELKRVFHVKNKYFFHEDFLKKQTKRLIEPQAIAYRSEEINSVSKTQSESIHSEFLNNFVEDIISLVSLPSGIINQAKKYAIDMLNSKEIGTRNDLIEDIALFSRNLIGMPKNSNDNLIYYIEKSGVFVFEKSIGEKIDAYSFWTQNEIPYIVLGNLKKSAVRRNFDLAHELGHLILHYKMGFMELDSKTYKDIEKEADLFAGCFLLPVEEFKNDFKDLIRSSNPDSYIDLKSKWKVSIQALAIRAKKLDLLTQEQYSYFWRSITRKGYKKVEPLDDKLLIAQPSKVKSILKLLFENSLIDYEYLTEKKFFVNSEFLYNLTGISADFFESYNKIESKNFDSNILIKLNNR